MLRITQTKEVQQRWLNTTPSKQIAWKKRTRERTDPELMMNREQQKSEQKNWKLKEKSKVTVQLSVRNWKLNAEEIQQENANEANWSEVNQLERED